MAAAPAAEAATTVRLVSEALSVLALELAAAGRPAAGVLTGVPASVEPAAATAAASAAEPIAAKGERPVWANGPAAASKECWVLNPVVGPKVILRKLSVGPAAAETAAAGVKCAVEPVSGPELPPAVSAYSDGIRADTTNGGSGVSQKKSKGWCDKRATEEEEVLASQDQRLIKVIPKIEYLIMYAFN